MPEKMPFIKSPEITSEDEQGELKQALETERLVYDYKVKREEILSIFDEVKQYMTYEDILDYEPKSVEDYKDWMKSKRDYENKKREYNAMIKKHEEELQEFQIIKEGLSKAKQTIVQQTRPPLFKDFQKLWEKSPKFFLGTMVKSIKNHEQERISEAGMASQDEKDREKIKQEIEARTFGKTVKIANLMQFHFDRLQDELGEYTEDDLKKIKAYGRANYDKIKEALSEIQEMRKGIQAAKSGKSVDVVRKTEEIAKIHGASLLEVKEFNNLLEYVLEDEFGEHFTMAIEEKYDKIGNLVDKDFITAYVNYHRELKDLHELLDTGKIVETADVKETIEQALPALKKDPPTIVYFHGDFGTGKTALAVHLSRTRFNKEPLIVAGSKFLDPDRFTEEFRIKKLSEPEFLNIIAKQLGVKEKIDEKTPLDVIIGKLVGTREDLRRKLIEDRLREDYIHEKKEEKIDDKEFQEYVEENKDKIPKQILKDINDQIDIAFTNTVQGRYMIGAMYQAMMEGKPLIIDEANAISPDVLIAFNDLLTRKIGEKIKTRADIGEFGIKEGYCVMWTGNTGEKYKHARFNDMDPATYSRLMPIKVKYLPQSREINNMQQLLERLELEKLEEKTFTGGQEEALEFVKESKEKAGTDQIFQVLLLKLLNDRLGAELLVKQDDRYSVFKDIYKLSTGARIIMDMFEGNAENLPHFSNLDKLIGSNDATVLMKKLKKSNLTLRELVDNIIGGYIDEGESMDIEHYLFKYVQKYDMYPEEQAIIYAILQKTGFFDVAENWPNYQTCNNLKEFEKEIRFNPLDKIEKYKRIRKNGDSVSLLNTQGDYKLSYLSSLETLQLMFGYLPPRKKEEYQELLRKQKEMLGDREIDAKKIELLRSIKEIRESLTVDLFETSKGAEELRDKIAELKLSDKKFVEKAIEKEFFEEVNKFNDILLDFLHQAGKIDEEQLKQAQAMDTSAKTNFIKQVLQKNK